ncbi:MAG: hypothetical protein LKF52_05625 [Butyrivibrio sp.]|jgi:cell division protein FtsL|nr:hypothetical protein [Butyrivibrio sp.]
MSKKRKKQSHSEDAAGKQEVQNPGRKNTKEDHSENGAVCVDGTSQKKETEKEREARFERLYSQLSDYEKALHVQNQKRIRLGMKLFLIIPSEFLALLFLTGSNKIVFLILWIISLFGLSFYLIGVEYVDYQLQIKLNEWSEAEKKEVDALISVDMLEMGGNLKGNIRQALRELKQGVVSSDEKHS